MMHTTGVILCACLCCDLFLYPVLCDFEIAGVQFDPDKVPAGIHAGDTRAARTHAVIQDDLARVRVGLYEIFEQRNGLLGGMDLFFIMLESDDIPRVSCTRVI